MQVGVSDAAFMEGVDGVGDGRDQLERVNGLEGLAFEDAAQRGAVDPHGLPVRGNARLRGPRFCRDGSGPRRRTAAQARQSRSLWHGACAIAAADFRQHRR